MNSHKYFVNLLCLFVLILTDISTAQNGSPYDTCEWSLCFGHPQNCIQTKTCELLLVLQERPLEYPKLVLNHTVYAKMLPPSGEAKYVAVGYSLDNKMGDDIVTDCNNMGGDYNVRSSVNIVDGQKRENIEIQETGIKAEKATIGDTMLKCTWIRTHDSSILPKNGTSIPERIVQVNLSSDNYILMAYGKADKPGSKLMQHAAGDRFVSSETIRFDVNYNCKSLWVKDRFCMIAQPVQLETPDFGKFEECTEKCKFALTVDFRDDGLLFKLFFDIVESRDASETERFISVGFTLDSDPSKFEISMMDIAINTFHKTHTVYFGESFSTDETNQAKSDSPLVKLFAYKDQASATAVWKKPFNWTHKNVEFDPSKNIYHFYVKFGRTWKERTKQDFDFVKQPQKEFYVSPLPLVTSYYRNPFSEAMCNSSDTFICAGMKDDLDNSSQCLQDKDCLFVLKVKKNPGQYTFIIRTAFFGLMWAGVAISADSQVSQYIALVCTRKPYGIDGRLFRLENRTLIRTESVEGIVVPDLYKDNEDKVVRECAFKVSPEIEITTAGQVKTELNLSTTESTLVMAYGTITAGKENDFSYAVVLDRKLDIIEKVDTQSQSPGDEAVGDSEQEHTVNNKAMIIIIAVAVVAALLVLVVVVLIAIVFTKGKKRPRPVQSTTSLFSLGKKSRLDQNKPKRGESLMTLVSKPADVQSGYGFGMATPGKGNIKSKLGLRADSKADEGPPSRLEALKSSTNKQPTMKLEIKSDIGECKSIVLFKRKA